MTISSSLNAGVAGLSANATRLGTISDNIANSNTFGYKRVEADFQSMVISSNGGSYSAGGVRASTQRLIDESGSLVATSNATDLAVRGRGLLPVAQITEVNVANGSPQMLTTTTGSFRQDAEGRLVTDSGLVLMGWPANPDGTIPGFPRDTSVGLQPVQINRNQLAGEPTTSVAVALNLPGTHTEDGATEPPSNLSIEYFDNLGRSENLTLTFTPSVPATSPSPATNEWTLSITDSASPGVTIGEYTLQFDDSRANGGNLLSVTNVGIGTNYDTANGTFIVDVAGGPMEIDIGLTGSADGLTQLSDEFRQLSISKDGSEVGSIVSAEVDPNGFVIASFNTGITRVLYQVPLVDVANLNGMIALDNQTYLPSPESGSFFLWDAGDGPTGDVVGFAREESATDVAGELTDMIQTQRAYSSNAKVIQTVDEMLQETTNIKR